MKISEKVNPELLKPGVELKFNDDGELIPIPEPESPFIVAQKLAKKITMLLECFKKQLETLEGFGAGDSLEVEGMERHIRQKYSSKLMEITELEDVHIDIKGLLK